MMDCNRRDANNGCRTVQALLLHLILCNFMAGSYGTVAIVTSFVPEIPHLAMDFAKEVLIWLVFHNQQFTPRLAVPSLRIGTGPEGSRSSQAATTLGPAAPESRF